MSGYDWNHDPTQNPRKQLELIASHPSVARDPAIATELLGQEFNPASLNHALQLNRYRRRAQLYANYNDEAKQYFWDNLSENERDLYIRNFGLGPPGVDTGGLLNAIAAPFRAIESATGPVGDLVGDSLRQTIQYLDVAGRFGGHLFRTTHKLLEDAGVDLNNPAIAAATLLIPGVGGGLGGARLAASLAARQGLRVGFGTGVRAGGAYLGSSAAIAGVGAGAAIFSDKHRFAGTYLEAFDATSNGEEYFARESRDLALEYLGDDEDKFAIAKALAAGDRIEEIAEDYAPQGSDIYNQKFLELQDLSEDPALVEAVRELRHGKISFGRVVANVAGLTPDTFKYNFVSGLTDATTLLMLDPFITIGAVRKMDRARRFGFSDQVNFGNRLEQLYKGSRKDTKINAFGLGNLTAGQAIRTTFDRLALGLSGQQGELINLVNEFPQAIPLIRSMQEYATAQGKTFRNADDVYEFFRSADGITAVASGRLVQRRDWYELPVLTRQGLNKAVNAPWFTRTIDFLADPDIQTTDEIIDLVEKNDIWLPTTIGSEAAATGMGARMGPEAAQALREGAIDLAPYQGPKTSIERLYENSSMFQMLLGGGRFSPVRNLARIAQGFTRQVPFKDGLIKLDDELTLQNVINYVEVVGMMAHLPTSVKNFWKESLISKGGLALTNAEKRVALATFVDGFLSQAGIAATQEGRDYIQALKGIVQGKTQLYGIGLNQKRTTGLLLDADGALQMRVPNMRELLGVSLKYRTTRSLYGKANPDLLGKAMNNVWKPSVLMRIGFIPRAAGEEYLAQIMRHPWLTLAMSPARWAAKDVGFDNNGELVLDGLIPFGAKAIKTRDRLRRMPVGRTPRELQRRGRTIAEGIDYDKAEEIDRFGRPVKKRQPALIQGKNETHALTNAKLFDAPFADHSERYKVLTETGEVKLFSDVTLPLTERVVVDATMAAKTALRKMIEAGRLGTNLDTSALVAARYVLKHDDPDWYTNNIESLGSLLKPSYDFADDAIFEDDLINIVHQMLTYDSTIASSYAGMVMSAQHAARAEVDALTADINSNDFEGLNRFLGNSEETKIVPMFGAPWVERAGDDDYFLAAFFSRVNHFIRKDRIARVLAARTMQYVNPSVRAELAASGLADAGPASSLTGYIDFLESWHKKVNDVPLDAKESFQEALFAQLAGKTLTSEQSQMLYEVMAFPAFRLGAKDVGRLDAPVTDKEIKAFINALDNLSSDAKAYLAHYIYVPEFPTEFYETLDDLREALIRLTTDTVNNPNFTKAWQDSENSIRGIKSGISVAQPVAKGHQRLYVPLLAQSQLNQFGLISLEETRRLVNWLVDSRGYDRELISRRITKLRGIARSINRNLEEQDDTRYLVNNWIRRQTDPYVSVWGHATSSYDDAIEFQDDLTEALQTLFDIDPPVDVAINKAGYVDIPEKLLGVKGGAIGADVVSDALGTLAPGAVRTYTLPPHQLENVTKYGNAPTQRFGADVAEGITPELALAEYAEQLVNQFNKVFLSRPRVFDDGVGVSGSEEILPSLIAYSLKADPSYHSDFAVTYLNRQHIADLGERLPEKVISPQYQPAATPNLWARVLKYGFGNIINPAIDAVARRPLFTWEFARGFRTYKANLDQLRTVEFNDAWDAYSRFLQEGSGRPFDFADLQDADLANFYYALSSDDFKARYFEWGRSEQELSKLFNDGGFYQPGNQLLKDQERVAEILSDQAKAGSETAATALNVLKRMRREIPSLDKVMMDRRMLYREDFDDYATFVRYVKNNEGTSALPWHIRDLADGTLDSERAFVRLEAMHREEKALARMATEAASERAFRAMIPYIDDRNLRSQFQEWVANYIPFHYAEEQFMKRWARTLKDSPEAIQKLLLSYNGLKASGVVFTNPERPDGGFEEDMFILPGSSIAVDRVAQFSSLIFGKEAQLPVSMPLTGKVKFAIPGLDSVGQLSPGPALAVPAKYLVNFLPEKEQRHIEDLFSFGRLNLERTFDSDLSAVLVPASLRRLYTATLGADIDNKRAASAANRAMQYLAAGGHLPPSDASAGELQEFQQRVQNWTRSLLITEAMFGFVSPAAPSFGQVITDDPSTFDFVNAEEVNQNLQPKFMEYLQAGIPMQEAVANFVGDNPDMTAWTVFRSKRNLPGPSNTLTDTALDWMFDNEQLLNDHRNAAVWLVPQPQEGEDFSFKAYNQQLAWGWRSVKGVDEFYEDLHFAAAAPVWQQLKDGHDAQLEVIKQLPENQRVAARAEEMDRWREVRYAFESQHPAWRNKYQAREGAQARMDAITGWRNLRSDPAFVDRPNQYYLIDELFQLYERYEAKRTALIGQRGTFYEKLRDEALAEAELEMIEYVRLFPSTRAFFNAIIKPEIRNG